MPRATETKMKWYICIVPCTLENLKKKRNTTLKTGKTAVASGQTQPIADYVDDRPHDIEYIDYVYQDMPGRAGNNAPAHLVGYYGATNIKETSYAEAPPTGVPFHLLDSNGEILSDEEIYKKGFDKSGFPIFWDGEEYIKEKKLYLQHISGKYKSPPKYFNDMIPDPNTSSSGAPKNFFEEYAKNLSAKDALIQKHSKNWAQEKGSIQKNRSFQTYSGTTVWSVQIFIVEEPNLTKENLTARLINSKGQPILYFNKWFDSKKNDFVYLMREYAGPDNLHQEADWVIDDDDVYKKILLEDSRGIVEFWRLIQEAATSLTENEFQKFKKFAKIAGYEVQYSSFYHDNGVSRLDSHLQSSAVHNQYWKDLTFINIKGKYGFDINDFIRATPAIKYESKYNKGYSVRGGTLHRLRIYVYPPISYIYGNFNLDAQILLSHYMKNVFTDSSPRVNRALLGVLHLVREKAPDKLITHRIVEQLHMQTRTKPYVPKNPVTYDPGIHVDAATHEKISHNVHDAVMKKKKKTSYTYGDHKPKDSKSVVIELDEVDTIMKPKKEYFQKHSDADKKTTIWDL